MNITIAGLKAKVLDFVAREEHAVEGVTHQLIVRFTEFVESETDAEEKAKALLEAHGYTVTPPAAPVAAAAPGTAA